MILFSQLSFWVPYIIGGLIAAVLFFIYFKNKNKFPHNIKWAFYLSSALFLISWASQILLLYLQIKKSPLNELLIGGSKSFFWQKSFDLSISFLFTLAGAFILLTISIIILKFSKRPLLEDYFPKLIFLLSLILGFSNLIPALIIAFTLAIIGQMIMFYRHKAADVRLSIVPFLLIVVIIIKIINFLPFYSNFLSFLRLI